MFAFDIASSQVGDGFVGEYETARYFVDVQRRCGCVEKVKCVVLANEMEGARCGPGSTDFLFTCGVALREIVYRTNDIKSMSMHRSEATLPAFFLQLESPSLPACVV